MSSHWSIEYILSPRWCRGCAATVDIVPFHYDYLDLCVPCVYAKQVCQRIAKYQGTIINKEYVVACLWRWFSGGVIFQHVVVILWYKGKEQWLSDAWLDADKSHTILKSYKDHRKAVYAGAKLPSSWPLLEVKNEFFKRTQTDINAEGELMCRRRFLQWAQDSVAILTFFAFDECTFLES